MKKEIFEFTSEERKILLRGLRGLIFYDRKGNQEDLEIIEKLEKEIEE